MAEQFQIGGLIVTFYCGPCGTQMVEVHVGANRTEMEILDFGEFWGKVAHELNDRLERQRLLEE